MRKFCSWQSSSGPQELDAIWAAVSSNEALWPAVLSNNRNILIHLIQPAGEKQKPLGISEVTHAALATPAALRIQPWAHLKGKLAWISFNLNMKNREAILTLKFLFWGGEKRSRALVWIVFPHMTPFVLQLFHKQRSAKMNCEPLSFCFKIQ